MMNLLQIFMLISCSCTCTNLLKSYDLTIGVMLPYDDPYLKPLIGYETSAGAVTVALEKVKRDDLLPGSIINIVVHNCQCKEEVTAGFCIKAFGNHSVDVMIMSPCAPTAFITAVLSTYFNIPSVNWASTTEEISNAERFRTVSRVIGSSMRLGRAVTEVLNYFRWRQVALFYTDDGLARKCYTSVQGLNVHLPKADILNVFTMMVEGEEPTDDDIDKFLTGFGQIARVAIICLDSGARRLMFRAQQRNMTGEEWVYILPEYVQNENKTDIWSSQLTSEGRNVETKLAYDSALFIEMQLANAEDLHYFKKQVIQKMTEWPFFYNARNFEEQTASLYSPFLHDAVYLYALALNRTLEKGGKKNDGRAITDNSRNVQFQGASGFVSVDKDAGRDPNFVLKILDKNKRLIPVAMCKLSNSDGKVVASQLGKVNDGRGQTVEILVPEEILWENRNGFVPTGAPKCGWLGELCVVDDQPQLTNYIIIGVTVLLLLIILSSVGMAYFIKRRVLINEMAQMLWKIPYKDITQLSDLHSRQHASFQSVSTTMSEDTAEAMLKGNECIAYYKSILVWQRVHNCSAVMSSEKDHMQMKIQRDLTHDNLNPFIGLSLDSSKPISIWLYCSKGSLEDVLQNTNNKLDWFFKYSFVKDIVAGMQHLMESGLQCHGHLKSSNCLLDSRWSLKITDYGLHCLRDSVDFRPKDKLWMAPELLRVSRVPSVVQQSADIYSLGIIISEILSREKPYSAYEDMTSEEIIGKVRKGEQPLFRPSLKNERDADVDANMVQLMKDCWIEEPERRPEIKEIRVAVKQMGKGKTTNLMDHVLKSMEVHSKFLETQVNDRTRLLSDEMKKSEELLYRMLPKLVIDKMRRGQTVEPETYDNVTIMFSDVPSFNTVTMRSTPIQTVQLLNDLYFLLDNIVEQYDVYKVETVNDQYLIVSGLPHRNDDKHASEVANLALHFQLSIGNFYSSAMPREKFELRIGINTGPVVAGVVGNAMPRYCLFGDAVNTASRIETNGKPSCIHISDETNRFLTQVTGGYLTKARGEIIVKGKGVMFTYWLLGKKVKSIQDRTDDGQPNSTEKPGNNEQLSD